MSLEFVATPIPHPAEPAPPRAHGLAPIDPTLREAFLAEGAARGELDRLFGPNALCVTTGQQPGLFTGPLYTVYKALSCAALARALERTVGRPVVPVFWVAGDDHDFAEAGHCHVLTSGNEVRRIALPPRPADAPLTPLYREPLGPAVEELLGALREETPPSEFHDAAFGWLSRAYHPDANLAQAFATALAALLGRFGVVVFQPTHQAAKRVMAPLLARALADADALEAALVARAGELERAGHPATVPVGDGATLVMIEGAAGRDRLVRGDGAFRTRRSDERFTLDAVRAIAAQEPTRLSPNVLLRPAVEAALLPTLAYLGGPGELSYLAQCEPVYRLLEIAPQRGVPRWSGLVVEGRVRKVLDKFGIGPDDLMGPEGQLERRLVRGGIPAEAEAALEALRGVLPREYEALRDAAARIDPTLRKPVESSLHAAEAGLRDLEKRMVSHLKQQNEILVQQVAKARGNLFPMGKPQERVFTVLPYLVRYGPAFLDDAYVHIARWAADLEASLRAA